MNVLDFEPVNEITGVKIRYGETAHGPHFQYFYGYISGQRHYRMVWFWIIGGRKVYDPTGWQGDWIWDYTHNPAPPLDPSTHISHVHCDFSREGG